jgi:hypothetical protein
MKRTDSSTAEVSAAAEYLMPWWDFEARFEPLEDLDGFGARRLVDVDLLESPRQRVIFLEDATVFGVGRRADAFQLPGGERRLEQVRRVEGAARSRSGTDQGVDLVDEQDRLRVVAQLLENALQALFEVATILGAGQQGAHVEAVDVRLGEDLGDVALDDAPRQPFGNGRLADAGFADQQGLFLRRRQSVWMTRSSSRSRPISGSILPCSARALRLMV